MDRYDQLGEAITKNVTDEAEKEAVLQLLMDIRKYEKEERERAVEAAKAAAASEKAAAESERLSKKNKRWAMVCATVCMVVMMLSLCVIVTLSSGQITFEASTQEQQAEGGEAVINNGSWEQYNDQAVNGGDS